MDDQDMDEADSLNPVDMAAGDYGNANNIMYSDFFAPPAHTRSQ